MSWHLYNHVLSFERLLNTQNALIERSGTGVSVRGMRKRNQRQKH